MSRILKRWVLVAWLALLPMLAHATAQIPDSIEVDGHQYPLQTNPLDAYLEKHPDAVPRNEGMVSSANWRGYLAGWRIDQDKLWLTAITIQVESDKKDDQGYPYVSKDVTERAMGKPGPIHATWYSGALIVPTGEMVDYVHMGYGSTYASYLLLVVKHGVLTKRAAMTHDEFQKYKQQSFMHYKLTPQYAKQVAEMKKDGSDWTQERIDDFLSGFAAEEYLSMPGDED